ncbi:hypothetical protein JHFBIEKO_2937 [Methylobacterium mesophilicum]|nr:hypothetical protein JHFBIEKO_2937 [Methylobacterium mesophilicum]
MTRFNLAFNMDTIYVEIVMARPLARPIPDPIQPGQESVWDYPRPPRLERVMETLRVVLGGVAIAQTGGAYRVLETSHPPTYYLPPGDVLAGALSGPRRGGICEWKGQAVLFDVHGGDRLAPSAAWSYPDPTPDFDAISGYVAFYALPMDACFVGAARVTPQPGTFYGGWITPGIVGPFKGGAGTMGW